jgi:hypothetical protein
MKAETELMPLDSMRIQRDTGQRLAPFATKVVREIFGAVQITQAKMRSTEPFTFTQLIFSSTTMINPTE